LDTALKSLNLESPSGKLMYPSITNDYALQKGIFERNMKITNIFPAIYARGFE
jgi:hypothetical protein